MIPLAHRMFYVDDCFLGLPRVIATAVIDGADGVALVDPGPSTSLPTLRATLERAGISMHDVSALLLTHIHLDHAGAAGTLAAENPRLRVFVHERGAPHLADPSKLLASASRLYGADMDRLWGDVRPVPADRLVVLRGGERVHVSGRDLDVLYTPGHASHHVSYVSPDTGIAFVGDAAGVRLQTGGYVMPPTPPPDIDVEVWRESIKLIDRRKPSTLFVTHFGPYSDPESHLASFTEHLMFVAAVAKELLDREATDGQREAWFIERVGRELRRTMSEEDARPYDVAGRFDLCWRGLARYWRKRGTGK